MFKNDKLRNSNSREKLINKNYTSLSYFMINGQIDYYSFLINERIYIIYLIIIFSLSLSDHECLFLFAWQEYHITSSYSI